MSYEYYELLVILFLKYFYNKPSADIHCYVIVRQLLDSTFKEPQSPYQRSLWGCLLTVWRHLFRDSISYARDVRCLSFTCEETALIRPREAFGWCMWGRVHICTWYLSLAVVMTLIFGPRGRQPYVYEYICTVGAAQHAETVDRIKTSFPNYEIF